MSADKLIEAFDDLVHREEGRASVALTMMKHVPSLSAEDARKIYMHVLTQRVGLVEDQWEGQHRDVMVFTEGLLCGLRVAALVSAA